MRYEVDSAQVTQASGAIQQTAVRINDDVTTMMRQLMELQSSWQGQAATRFQQVVTDWQATQERVRTSLEEIQRALAAAGRHYEEVEQAASAMFSG